MDWNLSIKNSTFRVVQKNLAHFQTFLPPERNPIFQSYDWNLVENIVKNLLKDLQLVAEKLAQLLHALQCKCQILWDKLYDSISGVKKRNEKYKRV